MKDSAIRYRLQQQAESYDRRQASARKRAEMWAKAQRYDEPREDENGKPMEDPCLSDGGRGAAIVRRAGELPPWEAKLASILDTYSEEERERIAAIADNDNLADAARSLGVSRMTLYRLKSELKMKLAVVLEMKSQREE